LTISIDHDVVDGAPMVRFVNYFQELIESGYGLIEMTSNPKNHASFGVERST
jgi:hypothetical protein